MRVAWDISHMEFTIEDHYYFSKLKKLAKENGIEIKVISDLSSLSHFDTLVLNYPEKRFNENEINELINFVEEGGRLIALGYYNNEDNVATVINDVSENFGMILLDDSIYDEVNNYDNDPLYPTTSNISSILTDVTKVMLPCSASVKLNSSQTEVLIKGEKTAKSNKFGTKIFAGLSKKGKGEFILFGTCVFWDNYSINVLDNGKLALRLLNYKADK